MATMLCFAMEEREKMRAGAQNHNGHFTVQVINRISEVSAEAMEGNERVGEPRGVAGLEGKQKETRLKLVLARKWKSRNFGRRPGPVEQGPSSGWSHQTTGQALHGELRRQNPGAATPPAWAYLLYYSTIRTCIVDGCGHFLPCLFVKRALDRGNSDQGKTSKM